MPQNGGEVSKATKEQLKDGIQLKSEGPVPKTIELLEKGNSIY